MFKNRRQNLLNLVNSKHPEVKNGIILLFAGFERSGQKFIQESSFFYFTGINEPATVALINLDGSSDFYIPNCSTRGNWVESTIDLSKAKEFGFDYLQELGNPTKGYELSPFFTDQEYKNLILRIEQVIKTGGKIFTLNPKNQHEYFEQRFILDRISHFVPNFLNSIIDVSQLVVQLRRKKSKEEIEKLYKAIDITINGQDAAISLIAQNKFEYEVQAGIEYTFISSNAGIAFPSIVGSGPNSTVLHYTSNSRQMKNGDLVVVDIGAEYQHYCGDITRTYPVSGRFSKRQREIYDIVLECQQYIEMFAKPGMWLSNKDRPEESLNHLAREFFKKKGYDQYFLHGLGHFLGLDVHDVGDYSEPLQVGDVITIEPGLYIAKEQLGVRIEDNYWIVEDGVVCLSEHLPKDADEIEKLVLQK